MKLAGLAKSIKQAQLCVRIAGGAALLILAAKTKVED